MVYPVSVVAAVAAALAVAGLAAVVVVLLYLVKGWSPGSEAQMGVAVIPCSPQ